MSEQSQSLIHRDWNPIATLVAGLAIGIFVGTLVTTGAAVHPSESVGDDPASVSCTSFIDETGNASGMCFVSGDVEFEWLGDDGYSWYGNQSTSNGTLSLDKLPEDNSTVRRENA